MSVYEIVGCVVKPQKEDEFTALMEQYIRYKDENPDRFKEMISFRLLKQVADPRSRIKAFRQYGKPSLSASLSLPVMNDLRQWLEGQHFDLVHIARAYMLPAIDAWPQNERPPRLWLPGWPGRCWPHRLNEPR